MIDKIAENFLYHIWDEQHLKEDLQTCDRKRLKVLYQGKWNTDAGPDFRNAIILLDYEKFQGDVEIHRTEYDWHSHNHNEDFRYNDVILHVVFQKNSHTVFTISESGRRIPILTLEDNLDESIEKLWQKYGEKPFDKLQKKSISCLLAKSNLTGKDILSILKDLGKRRFERKCRRFSAELFNSDFNQILYQGILEALGYSKNKMPFLKLSKTLTYQKLQGFSYLCKSSVDVFAILIIASGLNIEDSHFDFLNENVRARVKSLKKVVSSQISESILNKSEWNFFRVRPRNHPVCRMWQISSFLFSTMEISLINRIISTFSVAEKSEIKPKTIQDNFFSLINQNSSDRKYGFGKSRSNDMFANIVLPVCFVYAETLNYEKLKTTIQKIHLFLPKLAENYITTFIFAHLQKKIENSRQINLPIQQGMLQLYYQFCSHYDCKNCIRNLTKE